MASNKLRYVFDAVADNTISGDIDNQTSLTQAQVQADKNTAQPTDNYQYDAIGDLIKDVKEGISNIKWTVYGKIQSISKTDGTAIAYAYDASGNRISKTITPPSGVGVATFYVRDASGNTMSVYNSGDAAVNSGHLTQIETHLFGSSRLGIVQQNIDMEVVSNVNAIITFTRGNKFFELSNHLGNVLVTVSDKHIGHNAGNGTIDYYKADVVTATDYYPFGMQMPGRTYRQANSSYRYGFNGKENDNEVKGEGNQQDYGERVYDPRLGKFLSVDPLARSYPMLTPYQFASNRPIDGIDQDGLEFVPSGDLMTGQLQYYYLHKLALEHGEDPVENIKSVDRQTAKGHLITVVVVTDIFVTKGWLTRLAMGSQLFGAFEHNRAKTPEGRIEQDKRSTQVIVSVIAQYGVGKLIGGFIKTLTATNEIEYAFRKEDYDALVYDPDKGKITTDAVQELRVALTSESQVGTIVGRAPEGSGADFVTKDGLIDVKNAKKFIDAVNGTKKDFLKLLGTLKSNKDVKYVIDFKDAHVSGEEFEAAMKKFYDAGIKSEQIVITGTSSVEKTKITTF